MPMDQPRWQDLNKGAEGILGQAGVGTSFDTTNFGGQTTIGEIGDNYSSAAEHALSAGSAQMPMDQPRRQDLNKSTQGTLGQAGVGTFSYTTNLGGQTNIGEVGGNYSYTAEHTSSA